MTLIPTIIEQSARSDRAYDLISCLLKERIILLTSQIDDTVSGNLCAQLLYLASRSSQDIQLYINSPGGSVSAGLAIYDTMQLIRCDVSTICMGMAASMAAVLLAGGTRGKRYALPNSEIMIHQPLGGVQGQATDVKIAAEHILQIRQRLTTLLANATGRSLQEISEDSDRDRYFSAEEAKNYGLIDDLVHKQK